MRNSPESEECAPPPATDEAETNEAETLEERLARLDEEKLAALPDDHMVATLNQRRYLAHLKFEADFAKRQQLGVRKSRFKRT